MSRGRLLLLIAATAFALRLAVRLPRGGADLLASGYTFYLDMATSVLRGTGFCLLNGGFCASRMPGYPLVLTPFVWAGWTFPALVFLQAAVGATLVYAAWMLGAALFNGRIGMIAAAMAAISPYAVVHDTALQDTVFLNVLTAFGVAMLLDGGWRSAGCPRYAGAGLSLSLAVLTSARIAFVLPIAVAWTAWVGGSSWTARLRHAGLVALPMVALVGGWMVRNWSVVGSPVLSTQAGTDLWAANSPWTFSYFPRGSIDDSALEASRHLTADQERALANVRPDEAGESRLLAGWALDYMRTHPADTIAGGVRKVWVAASAQLSPARSGLTQTGYALIYGAVHVLAIAGLWHSRTHGGRHSVVWAFLLAFFATTAIYWAHTSHTSVIDVFLFVYASRAIAAWLPDDTRLRFGD